MSKSWGQQARFEDHNLTSLQSVWAQHVHWGVLGVPRNLPLQGEMCCFCTHGLFVAYGRQLCSRSKSWALLPQCPNTHLSQGINNPALTWKIMLCSYYQEKGTRWSHQPPLCHDLRHPALCCLFFPQCHCPPWRAAVCQGNRFSLFFVNSSLITFEIPQSVCTVIVEFDAND